MYSLKLTFNAGTELKSEIITTGYKYTQYYYNGLKSADGNGNFKIPFNSEIADSLKDKINLGKVKVEIIDTEKPVTLINTYYL